MLLRLVNEFGYSPKGAEIVWAKISQLSPMVASEFEKWWLEGQIPDMSIEGYSVQRLMNEHKMNPIAAFLTLDWIVRDSEKALCILAKGKDNVFPLFNTFAS